MALLNNDWSMLLEEEFNKPYYSQLRSFLIEEYGNQTIYPDKYNIYSALHLTSFSHTKVVIIGQDPYHGSGQAHGLSFSVKPGIDIPPSLRNIFKELQNDLACRLPNNGNLEKWAQQGVLLLNTVLTVRAGLPNSHRGKGWETFTDKVIAAINHRQQPVVFILWGKNAQEKAKLITNSHHLVIQSVHPSPLSAMRGFFGSRPFSRANAFLKDHGMDEIDWQIPNV